MWSSLHSRCLPTVKWGSIYRKTPECGAAAARRQEIPTWVGAADSTWSIVTQTNGMFQARWLAMSCGGWTWPDHVFRSSTAARNSWSPMPAELWRWSGGSRKTRFASWQWMKGRLGWQPVLQSNANPAVTDRECRLLPGRDSVSVTLRMCYRVSRIVRTCSAMCCSMAWHAVQNVL